MGATFLDTFTGTNGAAWSGSWTTTANGGTIDIQSNAGRALTAATSFTSGPMAYLSSATANTDFDIYIEFQMMGTTTQQYLWFGGSSDGSGNLTGGTNNGYELIFFPDTSGWAGYMNNAGTHTAFIATQSYTYPAAGTWLASRFKKQGTNFYAWAPVVRGSAFAAPVTATDSTFTAAMKPHLFTGNGGAGATTVLIDNFTVLDPKGPIGRPTPARAARTRAAFF